MLVGRNQLARRRRCSFERRIRLSPSCLYNVGDDPEADFPSAQPVSTALPSLGMESPTVDDDGDRLSSTGVEGRAGSSTEWVSDRVARVKLLSRVASMLSCD